MKLENGYLKRVRIEGWEGAVKAKHLFLYNLLSWWGRRGFNPIWGV